MVEGLPLTRRGFLIGVAAIGIPLPAMAAPAYGSTSGAAFYATLDLDRPELAQVAARVAAMDFAGANLALQLHYAARTAPAYFPITGDPARIPKALEIAAQTDIDWGTPATETHRFLFYDDLIKAYLALPAGDQRRDTLEAAWMALAKDFIAEMGDVPIGDPPHNRLTEGIRLRYWLDAFSVFRHSTTVQADDMVAYLDYIRRSADDIRANIEGHRGNNWYVSLARSIYLSGGYLPEFKNAPTWRFKGIGAAYRFIDRNTRSDGLSYEPAINYQNYALSLMADIHGFGALNGDTPLSREKLSFVLLQAEAMAAVTMPDFSVPLWGDTQFSALEGSGTAAFGDLFGRGDLTWVATKGAAGRKPAWGSMLYPQSYAVLRSGWDRDDQYLFIANQDTDYAASHRHPDDLSVVAYAHGRALIVDPGAYDYSESPSEVWLRRTTEAHNTVEVDGLAQPKTSRDLPLARRALRWYSNAGFDFYEGEHEDYKPVLHRRGVFSPKPGFWIVSDVLTGSEEAKAYRQLWHFPADAPVTVGTAEATAGFGSVPGVVIVPLDPHETTTRLHRGGWVADGHGKLHSDVDYLSIDRTTTGAATFDTLLYPGPAGAAPQVSARRIPLPVPASQATAMRVGLADGGSAVFYLSREETPPLRGIEGLTTDGRLCYIEKNASGEITRLALAAATRLVDGATSLVSSTAPINDLSVTYRGSTLILSTGAPLQSSLRITAPRTTEVILNGRKIGFSPDDGAITITPPPPQKGATLLNERFGAVRGSGARSWRFIDHDTEHWQAVHGSWRVTRDASGTWWYGQATSTATEGHTVVRAELADVSVTADVRRGATSAVTHGYGLLLRYRDARNHYRLQLYRTAAAVQAQIVAVVGGSPTVLAAQTLPIDLTAPHQLTGTVHAGRIAFAVDGTTAVTAKDDRLATGGLGLYTHRTEASFADVRLEAGARWDFGGDRVTGWRGISGTWSAADGAYRQANRRQREALAMTEHHTADVDVSATIQLGATGSSAHGYGIALRTHDDLTHYMARVYRTSDGTFAQLYKVVGGSVTNFTGSASGVPLSLDLSKPHLLRARASGDLVQFWIDGRLVATAVDAAAGTERIPTGGVGLQAHNAEVSFDDVVIIELTDPRAWSATRGLFTDIAESLRIESSGRTRSRIRLAETVPWRDYVAEATILPDGWTGPGEVGLTVRATGDSLGYRCVLAATGEGTYARIERYADGSQATREPVRLAERAVSFSRSGPLQIEVSVYGSRIDLRLAGDLMVSATDTLIGRGGVGVTGSGVDASITHVKVRELT